jgi:5-methylcytosine-specific restriction endonuclease McrA
MSRRNRTRWTPEYRAALEKYRRAKYIDWKLMSVTELPWHEHLALYDLYLKSDQWREKAAAVKLLAHGKCEVCDSPLALQVHHIFYDCLFDEPLDDLACLCRDCHVNFHTNYEGREVHGIPDWDLFLMDTVDVLENRALEDEVFRELQAEGVHNPTDEQVRQRIADRSDPLSAYNIWKGGDS